MKDTFRSIIDLWPNLSAYADDIDVEYGTAQAMYRRNRIDSAYWPEMISGAARRCIEGVTLERLAAISASQRSAARRSNKEGRDSGSPPTAGEPFSI